MKKKRLSASSPSAILVCSTIEQREQLESYHFLKSRICITYYVNKDNDSKTHLYNK